MLTLCELAQEAQKKRKEKGVTLQALSDLSGPSVSTIKRFERGNNVGSQEMFQILSCLNISLKIDQEAERGSS